MSELLFVCAGNHRQAVEHAISKDTPRSQFRYIDSVEKIRGLKNITLVAVGTYYENPKFYDIRKECVAREIHIEYK